MCPALPSGECRCPRGWRGRTCSEDINECTSTRQRHRCEYRCINTEGSYRCVCPADFELAEDGRRCRRRPEDCPKNCMGRGLCRAKQCVCDPGWSGQACQVDVNECARLEWHRCQSGCVNTKGSYRSVTAT